MKKFDIEEAKAGAKVCTRSGEPVRILCFDRAERDFQIVALVGKESQVEVYMEDGRRYFSEDSQLDLRIHTETKHGWIPLYSLEGTNVRYTRDVEIYNTYPDAEKHSSGINRIAIAEVTWEE